MQVKLRKIGMITLLIYFPTLFRTVRIMLIVFSSDLVYVGRGLVHRHDSINFEGSLSVSHMSSFVPTVSPHIFYGTLTFL